MIVIKYVALLPAHLMMGLLCWLLSPFLPLFAIGRDTLPEWLSWFQTPDATLDGDSGFAALYPPEKWPRYVRRVLWLIRNPAYGFAWSVLAYTPTSQDYAWYGTMPPSYDGYSTGWFYVVQPDGHFEFALRFWTLPGRQFRFRCGWRIVDIRYNPDWGGPQKYIFTLNPIKKAP